MYSPSDVKSAIAAHTLVPSFQRIVNLASGRIAGFEVLARCQHPTLGTFLPDNFIQLAEELRMMREITQLAVEAITVAATVQDIGLLSINLSRSQFGINADLLRITAAAREACFPLERIVLEVSEETILRDINAAEKVIRKFKEMGYRVALDNCGGRFLADSQIQQIGFDILKIDRRISLQLLADARALKTMRALVALSRSLRTAIIAVGIESKAQQQACQSTGCRFAEGFLFGRPVLPDELRRLLNSKEPDLPEPNANCQSADLLDLEAMPDLEDCPASHTSLADGVEPLALWSPELSVGVEALDEDHRTIIAMLNEVHSAVYRGLPREELEAAIEQLVLCTMDHFEREEQLFERTRFPAASLHRAEHDNFRRRVFSLQRRIEAAASLDEMKEVFPVLRSWLMGHLCGSDQQYRSHLNAHGVL